VSLCALCVCEMLKMADDGPVEAVVASNGALLATAPTCTLMPVVPPAAETVCLRYILGRVRAMGRHSPEEIDAIAQSLYEVRLRFHLSKHDWLQHVTPIFIGFHGFATDFERSVFLRVLKHATKPRVLHSAFMPGGVFEGFAILHPTTASAEVSQIELLVEKFKMSAGVTDLGQYMSAPMVACIERVENGVRPYGNFRSLRAGNVRTAYTHAVHRRDAAVQLDRVRTETGLSFTTGNMLSVHYQLNNTQIELGQAFALLYRLRALISSMPLALDLPTAEATHITLHPPLLIPGRSVQGQYTTNLTSLIDSFVNHGNPAPRVAVEVVDLTM